MSKLALVLTGFLVVVLAGGSVLLATWDIPPPTSRVEKTISHDRSPR